MSIHEKGISVSSEEKQYDNLSEYEAWFNHPKVQELLAQLTGLTSKIHEYEAAFAPLEESYKAVKTDFENWEQEMRDEMSRRRAALNKAFQLKDQVKVQLMQAKQTQHEMNGIVGKTVQELEASKRMEEAEQHWVKLMDEHDWLWKSSIRPFQLTASRFMAGAFTAGLHGVLCADQMGLGKTLEAEAAIDMVQSSQDYDDEMADRVPNWWSLSEKERQAVLWVCPNSIKVTTRTELAKWNPARLVAVLDGPPAVRDNIVRIAHANGLTLVVNYETLSRTPALGELTWPVVVLDEAHAFKNEQSQVFTLVETICKKAGLIFPMTGTPITNRPDEFWAILHMLTLKGKYEGKFADKWRFISEYCYKYGNVLEFAGAHGYERLIKNVQNMVIRRRKDEVELELPDKVREVRYVQMGDEQRALYDQMRDQFYVWLKQEDGDFDAVLDPDFKEDAEYASAKNPLSHMTRLRQIALYPKGVKIKRADGTTHVLDCTESAKMDEAMVIIEELIDNDEKCLVFATTNAALFAMQERIAARGWTFNGESIETAAIVGGVDPYKKNRIVEAFNDPESPLRIVVGNIKAMGIGLNLQGSCSHAVFLDLWWAPGVNEQAEDRLHRGGQKNAVTIHIIQAEDCIDAFIAQKLDSKTDMIAGIMERKELRKAIENGLI